MNFHESLTSYSDICCSPSRPWHGWDFTSANSYLGAALSLSGLLLAHALGLLGLLCGGVLGVVEGRHTYEVIENEVNLETRRKSGNCATSSNLEANRQGLEL